MSMNKNPFSVEFKIETLNKENDEIEIVHEIAGGSQNRNNSIQKVFTKSKPESNSNQSESSNHQKLEQLEQMQVILLDANKMKSNEILALKKIETNLSNEIIDLKDKLSKNKEIIETKLNEINDFKTRLEKYEIIKVKSENHQTSIDNQFESSNIKDEKIKQLEEMNSYLLDTIQMKKNEIETLKQNEINLNDQNKQLNNNLLIATDSMNEKDNKINLLKDEINNLKENLSEALQTIGIKTNEINDLKSSQNSIVDLEGFIF